MTDSRTSKFPMKTILLVFLLLTGLATARPLMEEDNRFYAIEAEHGMVVGGEPHATQIGLEVLMSGGNAVDAAVATALALAVTLPRAGNLGGGGFMMIRDPQGQVYALDFREMAPAAAHRDMYLDGSGQVDRERATVGALAVGVPGSVAGLSEALERFGTRDMGELLQPSIRLAEQGFRISPWMSRGLRGRKARFEQFPASMKKFFPGGRQLQAHDLFQQPDLAKTLKRLAEEGPREFYEGRTADLLVAAVQSEGGLITKADLKGYKPVWRQPVVGSFRGHQVYSMPPPSSGGIHLIQMLNILEPVDFDVEAHNSAAHIHLWAEAMRSAYADRSKFLGDPDFVKVPVNWLTSKTYAEKIRKSIPLDRARKSEGVDPGDRESTETTHLSVVDQHGYAVSLTTTLNFSYGNAMVAEGTGFLLNNEMDDFAAAPGQPNAFGLLGGEANAIAPGKRPLSSMTPTIVVKEDRLSAVLGAPGGSRIITSVLQALLNNLAYGFNAASSVSLPRIHHQWKPDILYYEQGISKDTREKLEAMGHKLERTQAIGHVMLIQVREDGTIEGGADPRRPAAAMGH